MGILIKHCRSALPGSKSHANPIPQIHKIRTAKVTRSPFMAIDAEEVAKAIAVNQAVQEMVLKMEDVAVKRLIPVVISWNYHVVSPSRD